MLLMVFKVIQLIGFGDYGHVYRASHRNLVNSMQTGFLQNGVGGKVTRLGWETKPVSLSVEWVLASPVGLCED